ncbi:MAG: carbohydrate-binding domain-containing protein [Oscillospiraceae bacterium]|nr:carbohydrate-binding domain-containing protein [Oscillospiraceae bacterium]
MKKTSFWILLAVGVALIVWAVLYTSASSGTAEAAAGAAETSTASTTAVASAVDTSGATEIQMDGTTAKISGSGASAADGTVTITSGGTYRLTGAFAGQVLIKAAENQTVTLVLSDAEITNSSSVAIYAETKCTVILDLEGASSVSDAAGYTLSEDDTGAAIFTKGDLTILGDGSLSVNGFNHHGIQSKGNLTVASGSLTVLSAGDGLKGKETVTLAGGTISIASGGDGVQSSKANVLVSGGSLTIDSAGDGIVAETELLVTGGTLQITAGGGAASGKGSISAKGLKGLTGLTISGGEITVNSGDDCLHSNGNVTISGGTMTLASGDDGVHADGTLTVESGDITISQSYEGLEGADILISAGNISITASDDGLNAAGTSSDQMMTAAAGGTVPDDTTGEDLIRIDGGTITINAGGDGVDSNGYILMTGGTLLVDGPSDSANGALDSGLTAEIRGGTVVAVGASGMAEGFSSDSSQCSILDNLDTSEAAGTNVTLTDASGTVLVQFTSAKTFNSVVVSCPDLTQGETYTLTVGDTSEEITLDSASVTVGTTTGGMGGQGGVGSFGGQGNLGGQGGTRP